MENTPNIGIPQLLILISPVFFSFAVIEEHADDIRDTASHVIVWQVLRESRTYLNVE